MRHAPLLILLTAGLTMPEAASAQSMNAEAFFRKAQALKAKGAMALMSRDLGPMIKEAKSARLKARSTRLAAVAAGRTPRYCPPREANAWAPRNSWPEWPPSLWPNASAST